MLVEQVGNDITADDFKLKYFLTQSDIFIENEEHITYGIKIEKFDANGYESSKIVDVNTNKNYVENIINIMKENSVMPIHLHDIIENFI